MKRLLLVLALLVLCTGIASAVTESYWANTAADAKFGRDVNGTFYVIRNGVGTTFDNSTTYYTIAGIGQSGVAGSYDAFVRYGWSGDTSAIPDTANFASATFAIYGTSTKSSAQGNLTATVTGFTPADPSSLSTGDYNTSANTVLSSNITWENWSTTGWNTFTLNAAGLAYINKSGYTSLMVRFGQDVDNTTTGLNGWGSGSYSTIKGYESSMTDTNYDPVLTVTYTDTGILSGASFNPTNVTNLTSYGSATTQFTDTSTNSPTSWSWTYAGHGTDTSSGTFSILQNPSRAFGVGNWSIRLTATNSTGSSQTDDHLHWVNVTQWDQLSLDMLPLFPSNHIINADISGLPVDDESASWINAIQTHKNSVSGNIYLYGYKGYIYNYVGTGVPSVSMLFDRYSSASSQGLYNQPEDWQYETTSYDQHSYTINRDTGYIYETAYVNDANHPNGYYPNGTRVSGVGRIWDRANLTFTFPLGTTSTTAAGMPATSGGVTDADIVHGGIDHALSIALGGTRNAYIWPASHASGVNSSFPPMGARIRLKAGFNTAAYSGVCKMELDALKTYGGIIQDNYNNVDANNWNYMGIKVQNQGNTTGGTMCSGVYINSANFEFVDQSSLMVSSTSYAVGSSVSSFAANVTGGVTPLTVQFTDTSAGTPTNWDWYWSADETKDSDLEDPTATFTTGTYNVRLWTDNAIGGSWANTTVITVSAGAPAAAFSGTPVSGITPLTVTFTDASTNTPTSWAWYYGTPPGTLFSTEQNPTRTFSLTGDQTIILIASNAWGSDTETKVNYITVNEDTPDANFAANYLVGNAPLTVTFTDSSVHEPTSWAWTFGDGGTSALQNPSHTYTTLGSFTVTLTATNAGGSDIETKNGYITIVAFPEITYTPAPTGPGSHSRAMAASPITTIPNTHYLPLLGMLGMGSDEIINTSNMTPRWSEAPLELMEVYTDYMGPIAFLIVFLIPFGMMWLAHGNMKLLSILGLITCAFVFLYLPANYAAAAVICIVISLTTLLWSLFKQ
jgi:PKD repeat protein